MVISSCVLVAADSTGSLFVRSGWCSIVSVYPILIHSAVDGHLGSFYVLAVVSSAARNIGVRISFLISILSAYTPRSGIVGSYGSCFFFSFLRKITLFSTVAEPVSIPTSSVGGLGKLFN